MTYKIIRLYKNASMVRKTIKKGLTLEQAQAHCSDPETSSSTATESAAVARTRLIGDWFDGYEAE